MQPSCDPLHSWDRERSNTAAMSQRCAHKGFRHPFFLHSAPLAITPLPTKRMRYDRKLWMGDFLKSMVYLPFEQSNRKTDVGASAGRKPRRRGKIRLMANAKNLCA